MRRAWLLLVLPGCHVVFNHSPGAPIDGNTPSDTARLIDQRADRANAERGRTDADLRVQDGERDRNKPVPLEGGPLSLEKGKLPDAPAPLVWTSCGQVPGKIPLTAAAADGASGVAWLAGEQGFLGRWSKSAICAPDQQDNIGTGHYRNIWTDGTDTYAVGDGIWIHIKGGTVPPNATSGGPLLRGVAGGLWNGQPAILAVGGTTIYMLDAGTWKGAVVPNATDLTGICASGAKPFISDGNGNVHRFTGSTWVSTPLSKSAQAIASDDPIVGSASLQRHVVAGGRSGRRAAARRVRGQGQGRRGRQERGERLQREQRPATLAADRRDVRDAERLRVGWYRVPRRRIGRRRLPAETAVSTRAQRLIPALVPKQAQFSIVEGN
jgi:hypothetical protein